MVADGVDDFLEVRAMKNGRKATVVAGVAATGRTLMGSVCGFSGS